jgi:hypothetical protein
VFEVRTDKAACALTRLDQRSFEEEPHAGVKHWKLGELFGFLAEIDDLWVEEFCGQRFCEGVDGGLLLGSGRRLSWSRSCAVQRIQRMKHERKTASSVPSL